LKQNRQRNLGSKLADMCSLSAIAGNTVFVGDFTGKMYAVDLASPDTLGEFSTDVRKQHAAAVLKNDT
jgi:hypothetical protein